MPQTFLAQLACFADFLHAYTHTLLYLRRLYPPASFTRARFHNTPVWQSRHPAVCEWLRSAINHVHKELPKGTVARIAILIYWHDPAELSASRKVLERHVIDVSRFPVVEKSEQNREIEWDRAPSPGSEGEGPEEEGAGELEEAAAAEPHENEDVDMSEEFRAALVQLSERTSQLKPLPKGSSFTICVELKDEPGVDPPVGHPQPWIPVESSLQKTGRKGAQATTKSGPGEHVKVTPIRTVEAGVLRFETFIVQSK